MWIFLYSTGCRRAVLLVVRVIPGRVVLYGVVVLDFFNKYIYLFLSALGLSYGMWDLSLWSAGSCCSVWASAWLQHARSVIAAYKLSGHAARGILFP